MKLRFLAISSFIPVILIAQEMPSDIHQFTQPPVNARFEIVQSEIAAKWTFRLNRYQGSVDQFVVILDNNQGNTFHWQPMKIDPIPVKSKTDHPHFQIFTSGIVAKNTFLIDTDTGFTWCLITSKESLPDGSTQDVSSWSFIGWVEPK